jgi:pimeloyl-ACP methyl ester carboxylesterase
MAPMIPPRCYMRSDGVALAYRFTDGAGPLLVFLPGYMSDMEGGKAQAVFSRARQLGRACLLFDYSGCGSSSGAFVDGALDIWRDDALALIDHVWGGSILPIGSSMGGWIALLIALARPAQTVGLMGIAAAPDFTQWGFSDAEKAVLMAQGRLLAPNDYGEDPRITTLKFWQSGQASLLLGQPIALDCPVRLLHGQRDDVVPGEIPVRLAHCLCSSDVQTLLIKDGDHRLSRDRDIASLLWLIDDILDRI